MPAGANVHVANETTLELDALRRLSPLRLMRKSRVVRNSRSQRSAMKRRTASSFSFIEPMKTLRVGDQPTGDWLYEMKFDGYQVSLGSGSVFFELRQN